MNTQSTTSPKVHRHFWEWRCCISGDLSPCASIFLCVRVAIHFVGALFWIGRMALAYIPFSASLFCFFSCVNSGTGHDATG
ncbi:hypothetical protein IWZ01DRAFT_365302 [Phyllosticta capitalensis]